MAKRKKPSGKMVSLEEPAERPITIALSTGELLVLLRHHEKEIKSVWRKAVKFIGESAQTTRDIKSVKAQAEKIAEAHLKRAKGLSALLADQLEKEAQP